MHGGGFINHIGSVIKKLRTDLKLSRAETVKNICTDKYLYLIETSRREPSVEIVRLLGARLGSDLFEYYSYLDCFDPIQVCETVKLFSLYRVKAEFGLLEETTVIAEQMRDFARTPWRHEIELNRLAKVFFLDRDAQGAINAGTELLNSISPRYLEEPFTANAYVVISTAYQALGLFDESARALAAAENIISSKLNIPRYRDTVLTVKLNRMTLFMYTGDYDNSIKTGLWINSFQQKMNAIDRSNFMFFYLADSFYNKGDYESARGWFEKCLCDLIVTYCPTAAYYISGIPSFYKLIDKSAPFYPLAQKVLSIYSGHIQPEKTSSGQQDM